MPSRVAAFVVHALAALQHLLNTFPLDLRNETRSYRFPAASPASVMPCVLETFATRIVELTPTAKGTRVTEREGLNGGEAR